MTPRRKWKAFDSAQAQLLAWQAATPGAAATIWWLGHQIVIRCSVGNGTAWTIEFLPEAWEWAVKTITSTVSKAPEVKS